MNSMLKQHHIRLQDLKGFLRGYGTNKPQTPEEWAIQESKMYAPGMLIFCLDSIAAPPGLAQFSKKEAGNEGETYRVKDMSVVVNFTDGKPLAVNITSSAFDARFVDQLMLEKARKAILDGRDFLYVAANTAQPLDPQVAQVLDTMATTQYTQGGSRRTLAAGDTGVMEPAQALLGALGVTINTGGPTKHVLDIGNVCHLLFAPEGRQEDKNKVLMKTCFQPLPGDPAVAANEGQGPEGAAASPAASAPPQMKYEDVTPQAGVEAGSGWSDPTQWVEPQVPEAAVPEAWQPPAQEIPFPNQPSQWTAPGSMDQAAASFLNPDAPVQVPDFPQATSAFDAPPPATPPAIDMPRPAPLGQSPRQSMTGFKAVEDTGTFRKFDNAAPSSGQQPALPVQDLAQAAAAAFAASAAGNDTAANAAPAAEATEQPWMPIGTPSQPFLPPPVKSGGQPQQIRPQAIRPQSGGDPVAFQVETGIYQQFGAPPKKPEPAQPAAPEPEPAAGYAAPEPEAPPAEAYQEYTEYTEPQAAAPEAEAYSEAAPDQAAAAYAEDGSAEQAYAQPEYSDQQYAEPQYEGQQQYAEQQQYADLQYADQQYADQQYADQQQHAEPQQYAEPQVYDQAEPAAYAEAPAEEAAPAVDESNLSLFDRLNLKLSKVKQGSAGAPAQAAAAPASQPAAQGQAQESAELFGWETPEDTADAAAQTPLFPLAEEQSVDEWQSWDTPTPSEVLPASAQQQETGLAEALSGLIENQSTYDEPAAYATNTTSSDFASSDAQGASYESNFVPDQETPPGWAEFQESFKEPSSYSESAAPGEAPAAAEPAADSWEQPFVPEAIATPEADAPTAEVAADVVPAEAAVEVVAEEAQAPSPAPVPAPQVVPPAISASNPFLAPLAPPPPPPAPPEPEAVPEPVAEVPAEPVAEEAVAEAVPQTALEALAAEPPLEESAPAVEETVAEEPAAPEPPPAPKPPRKPTAEEQAAIAAEMASFQKKLEQQLAKAAKKLNSRVEEIKAAVAAEMERLANESSESDKQSESSLAETGTRFTKQLENITEDVRLKISDAAANGRYTIKQLLTTSQSQIEEERNLRYEELREASKQFRADTEALSRGLEREMQETVNKRTQEVGQMVDAVINKLKDTGDGFVNMVELRFQRFQERMGEETNTVTALLDRSVNSMMDELEGTNEKSSDKLKSAKSDFEQTINYQVRTAELTLSRKTRQHLTLTLLPKLNERKEILRAMSTEMCHRFSEESALQVNAQMQGLEASLNAAKGQLHNLVTECLSNIDSVGRNQQAGLEEIFKDASTHIEKCTSEVTATLASTEKQIQETEQICKKLAETSSVDADPQLTEVRNTAHTRVLQIKQQATSGLITTIDSGCDRLEQVSQQVQQDLTTMRTQYSQGARQASDNGLATMRDAIQEALAAIQAAREKYME